MAESINQENAGKLSPVTKMTIAEKAKYFASIGVPSLIGLEAMGWGGAGLLVAGIAGGSAAFFSEEIRGVLVNMRPERTGVSVKVGKEKKHLDWNWLMTGEVGANQDAPQVIDHAAITEQLPVERTRMLPENQQATRRLNEEDDLVIDDSDYEDELLPAPRSGMFVFSEVLATFTPTLKKIYIGTLPDGTHLFCEAKDLCHVALAGSTGGGKSSVARMIVAQLCKAGARVLLLNPHYTRYDIDADEDWTPFDPYLYRPAMECRPYGIIGQYLEKVATDILPKRLERYAHSQPVGKPYFLVLDELPAIVSHCKEASGYLSTILREGRKVGIFLIVASQDFLVKTLFGNEGGAVRECFRTAIYVGGDATTAKILLDMPANQVPEEKLGRGTVMIRGAVIRKASIATVPYVDNDSLYQLLGPSTFKRERVVEVDDELVPLSLEAMMAELSQRPERDEQDDEANYEALVKQQERIEKNRHSHVEPVQVVPTPIIADRGPRANDIDLVAAIAVWNAGYNSENKLMKAFPGMTKYQANLLRERIVSQVNVNQEVAE